MIPAGFAWSTGQGDRRAGEKVPICGRNRRPEPAGWRVREIGRRRSNGLKAHPSYGVVAVSPLIGLQNGENGGRWKGAPEARTNEQMGNRFGGALWGGRAKLAGLANRRCVRVVTYQRCPTCAVLAMHESRQRSAWRIFFVRWRQAGLGSIARALCVMAEAFGTRATSPGDAGGP